MRYIIYLVIENLKYERIVGPVLGGTLWSWSLTNNMGFPFNYWFLLLLISFLGIIAFLQSSYILTECPSKGRDFSKEDILATASAH